MKITKLKIILVIIGLTALFFYGKNYALAIDDMFGPYVDVPNSISVTETNLQKKTDASTAASNKNWLQKFSWDKLLEELRKQSGVAFKAAMGSFLNNLAVSTATYLATGNWGQSPMFETKDFGTALKNAADNAAGTFIENLGSGTYVDQDCVKACEGDFAESGGQGRQNCRSTCTKSNLFKFNLCSPDPRVMLKINLGLRGTALPKAPPCTFSKLTQNWQQALKSKNFLPQFQDMFNPWSNDLGIALTLQTGMSAEADRAANIKAQELMKNSGFKDVVEPISKYIKSPAKTVIDQSAAVWTDSTKKELTYTGTIADAIDVFINTLAGKLLDKWLKKGLVSSFPPLTSALDNLTNPDAQNQSEGAAGAADRMNSIMEPNFKVRGDYNILNELATCPDPNKAGPTNCVIDEKFRQAIEKRLTVGQAMEQGFLSANGEFGFTSDGLEPKFYEGYPYRSMLILRKFRIIPVGWEVAAQKIKDQQTAVGGKINLKNLVDCFRGDDEYGAKESVPEWCQGLVDPNWVLKAPQNFCAREGAGPVITSEQITGQGADSSLSILRDENYCADEKSLIKENSDGSNPRYGYCTEERRTWDFNSKSCEPRDNTCQTFKSETGQTVSYLQNTLDYGNCTANNAGCLRYARDGVYANGAVDWTRHSVSIGTPSVNAIYLNKNAQECEAESEGCHQLIRLNPGGGANLLVNSDFEEAVTNGGWDALGTASSTAYQGAGSLEITKNDPMMIIAGKDDYNIAGESYTLSFYSKNCSGAFNIEDTSASLASGADWAFNKLSYVYPQDVNINKVNFSINASSNFCLIDNIKLEKASQPTAYSDYGAPNQSLVYEKLLPGYLAGVCYTDKDQNGTTLDYYKPVDNAPSVCSGFARQCKRQEAGCELYTGVTNGLKIPAQVKVQDYCPVECVGYNTFVQSRTNFESIQDAYFIPKTAKTCSAAVAGCDEFTNLEKYTETNNVAEQKEYYTALRQCVKPNTPGRTCGEFYTWEGSDESGFQLKVESLESTTDTDNKVLPDVTDYDHSLCDETIYNSPVGDPRHNDNCRQYYNRSGDIFYLFHTATKTCTDDCHPYRRTAADDTAENCGKHGGEWNTQYSACVYMAVPKQGRVCSAAANGCREYTGNTGNNVRNIFTDDFEADASTAGWQGVDATVERVNDSIILQNNTGHSMLVSANAGLVSANAGIVGVKKTVGTAVRQGRSYVLSFLAKADAVTALNIFLATGTAGLKANFVFVENVGKDWQIYKTNLANLEHQPTADEFLLIESGQNFYLDNITLTEITDRYYLIKDSWRTPAVCDSEADRVTPHAQFMLGCDQYQDRAAATHNLKQFNKLCSESAVGCEMMIDTKNSANPAEEIFNDLDEASKITVPKDEFIYAVYDQSKLCGREDKGCERLGKPYVYDKTTLYPVKSGEAGAPEAQFNGVYGDVYLKNNPDSYGQILCDSGAVGCKTWAYNNGAKSGEQYFKDPGDQVCEWRVAAGSGTAQNWYKKKVKRCDDGGTDGGSVNGAIEPKKDAQGNIIDPITSYEQNICLSDANCSIVNDVKCSKDADCGDKNKCVKPEGESKGVCHYSCLADNNDYICPTSDNKTLGWGGNSQVSQPGQNASGKWAGVCQPAASGCSEYLDPMSKFNTNLIFNGDFHKIADSPTAGWAAAGSDLTQSVILEPNTVYRLAATKPIGKVKLYCDSRFYLLKPDNALSEPGQLLEFNENNLSDKYISRYIYTAAQSGNSCSVTVANSVGAVELKPVVVDYQLAQNLDSASCNGAVDFDKGCVLFNERSQDGVSKKKLDNDADIPILGDASTASERDSNVILKVTPDRTCNQWLACKSYVKDDNGKNVCYDAGLCDAVDDNGNCSSFLTPSQNNQIVGAGDKQLSADAISNLSGYSEVGLAGGSLRTDYYPLGVMEQKGELANLSNGGFEIAGSNGYPMGWTYDGSGFTTTVIPPAYSGAATTTSTSWNKNIFRVIDNPIAAQTEGVEPAPEGRNFLKVGAAFNAMSDSVDVMPNNDYVLTAYINTLNLKSGRAGVEIINDQGANIITGGDKFLKAVDQGNGWQFILAKFNTGQASQIRIKLAGDLASNPQGNFYFDGIKIRPALNSKDDWYTNQSCRLYPQTDSLSCDYYDDAGKRQKGWYGYCLQYDRPPGDPNACLLWYPIDKVKGDGIEEGAGYQGRTPLYYCLEAQGYCGGVNNYVPVKYYCSKLVQVVTPTGQNKVWSGNVYQGSSHEVLSNNTNKYIDWWPSQISGLEREPVILKYQRDSSPFGAIVPPSPVSNPYEWDGEVNTDINTNIQPLNVAHLESEKSGARAGTPYYGYFSMPNGCYTTSYPKYTGACSGSATVSCNGSDIVASCRDTATTGSSHDCDKASINSCRAWEGSGSGGGCGCEATCVSSYKPEYKIADTLEQATSSVSRLFAQSYGGWKWDGTAANGRYVRDDTLKWQPPQTKCNGATRGNDLCAILPTITNVHVANSANNYTVKNTGFINLTFNSNIDGQQLPLVMYAVAWGDGATTTVSGVSMRDRSNPNIPHSLYHLYSYWDLKAKANRHVAGVDCTTVPGECRVKPKVQIKDNWGWCNAGKKSDGNDDVPTGINDCDQWEPFPATVVVKEK